MDNSSAMFSNLIMMLGTNGMMSLGKIPHPVTGRSEIQLEGAKMMIDMLDAVRQRTQGNLSDEESKLLDRTLSDLQLTYVAEMGRGRNPSSPAADTPNPSLDENGIPGNVA
jgi:hypothetical protein